MNKLLSTLVLATGIGSLAANMSFANPAIDQGENLGGKVSNVGLTTELHLRALELGSSATTVDTTYVGFSPGHQADNYFSIWSGSDKFVTDGTNSFHRPPRRGAMWDWETPAPNIAGGDSLQGWWSVRNQMTGTGGLTIPDDQRPWRCLDYGNIANYAFGANNKTFGVVGVWHVDGGNTVVIPSGSFDSQKRSLTANWVNATTGAMIETDGGVRWAPIEGIGSAWMGLRRHGDNTYTDPITKNKFNEDVMQFEFDGAVSNGGTDKKFPGYGAQMDQMLYRDVTLPAGATTLSVTFQYRTAMSTGFTTSELTRSGWFQHDPLTVLVGGGNPNFISNNNTNPAPPVDSFMVYVGAPAEGSVILSDGFAHTIYDPMRRWFGEVLRSNEGLYKQLFSKGGTNPAQSVTVGIDDPALATIKAATANRVRLVFRVKTNQNYDDETTVATDYSSGGVGAAILDAVTLTTNLGAQTFAGTIQGGFNATTDIDNSIAVSALNAWKSTGKPPQPFHHVHQLSPFAGLAYQDLCGQVGDPSRACNMQGQVVSAGDHDHSERSGGTFGSAEQEPFQGMFSPVINLGGQGYTTRLSTDPQDGYVSGPPTPISVNNMGLSTKVADASDDYYIDYELYTGIFDFSNMGNAWRFGFQCYPGANTASGAGEHKRWGEVRYPGFIYFNPDKQCFRTLDAGKGNGLIRTTNLSAIPDSIRIYLGTRQEAYRFGIPQSEWLEGAYWDNVSLALIDGKGANPVSVDIWQLYHDTFPASDDPLLPGTPSFDATTALIKSGLNIAPATGNASRFDVPGDTTVVVADGSNVRVDLVFRILPGPGNYVNPANGKNSQLRLAPTSPTPIATSRAAMQNSSNFWENYIYDNGPKGSGSTAATPGDGLGHNTFIFPGGAVTWNPQAWNSVRMDTAEVNVFQLHGRGILTPADGGLFMTAYHESELYTNGDPTQPLTHRGRLGIPRNICFVATADQSMSTQTVICLGNGRPPGVSYPPSWATSNRSSSGLPASCLNSGDCRTMEGTKIIPDGLLTPGSHVEYFFRRQDGSDPNIFLCPDTNVVTPQTSEGSTDGHRWQEFGVLPDRWKSGSYLHPVLDAVGSGGPCMLYVDQNDRRGNERVWVSIADSIGATASIKYGAHNGWHARGDGDPNDPTTGGWVRRHIGMPGTTWDMLGVKASESLDAGSGSIGSRGGTGGYSYDNPANTQINSKTSRIGPSKEMLEAYYKVIMTLTGDLSSSIFGPFANKSQDDFRAMKTWLVPAPPNSTLRGIFCEGEGFAQSCDASPEGRDLLTQYLGVTFVSRSYREFSLAPIADVYPTTSIDCVRGRDIYGLRNTCTHTPDVLAAIAGASAVTYYEDPANTNSVAPTPYASGVRKVGTLGTAQWTALTDGWNIENLTSRDDLSSRGRLAYFYNVFNCMFSSICQIQGDPATTTDTPNNNDGRLFNFMGLANNPMRSGSTTVDFGLAKAERVKIQIFDVSGRLVRTLADRNFAAGEHQLTWDGVDNQNNEVARGVYFVRSQHADSKFTGQSKLIVLR